MSTPSWQPGTLYPPGAIVQPVSALVPVPLPVTNGDFESGATAWTLPAGFSIGQFGFAFQGTWSLQFNTTATVTATHTDPTPVVPGQTIHGSCQIRPSSDPSGNLSARCEIYWYTSGDVFISISSGTDVASNSNNHFFPSTVTGIAPATAVFARFAVRAVRSGGGNQLYVDNCVWDVVGTPLPAGLVFKAVQAAAGYSAAIEPVWPVIAGNTVVDNQVTWQAAFASRVTWTATPILVSSTPEPVWPTVPDSSIADGTIKWVAMNSRITDTKNPRSKVVAIAASKVFAADEDIIAFCATVNPLDWSTAQDAGYLPFGLQTHGSTPCTALGLYRGNLVAFNSEGYQLWQVDEDPANMALLDASPIDCAYPKSIQPVNNDLVFLSALGIRSIGIAGASTNLQAGSFGDQIDPLVLTAIRNQCSNIRSLYWPGAGQYWLFFGVEAFVLTANGGPKDNSWSRYVFPSAIDGWALVGTDLHLRSGEIIWRVSIDALNDDDTEFVLRALESDCDLRVTEDGSSRSLERSTAVAPIPFQGVMQWPYLDFGQLGVEKQLEGFDLVCTGTVDVSFGYSQADFSLATDPYTVSGDTLPGSMVPFPISGPSFQFRLTFAANQAWEWTAASLYLTDQPRTP